MPLQQNVLQIVVELSVNFWDKSLLSVKLNGFVFIYSTLLL